MSTSRQLEAAFDNVLLLTPTSTDSEPHVIGVMVADSDSSDTETMVHQLEEKATVYPASSGLTRENFPGGWMLTLGDSILVVVVPCRLRDTFDRLVVEPTYVVNALFDVPVNDCVALADGISPPEICRSLVASCFQSLQATSSCMVR